jgi:hypothetical protein
LTLTFVDVDLDHFLMLLFLILLFFVHLRLVKI